MRNWTGTDWIPFHSIHNWAVEKWLLQGSVILEDYRKEELDEIEWQIEEFEREENDSSKIGSGGDEEVRENQEVSDPEDEVPFLTLQQTWWSAMHAPEVKPSDEPVGPNHTLPEAASPLAYFVVFLLQTFFKTASKETNWYARQTIVTKGTPDPL